jgi:hypothetical protein
MAVKTLNSPLYSTKIESHRRRKDRNKVGEKRQSEINDTTT